MKDKYFKYITSLFTFVFLILSACDKKSPTENEDLPQNPLYYGMNFEGWNSAIPASAVEMIADFSNTVLINGHHSETRNNIKHFATQDIKLLLNLDAFFAELLPLNYEKRLDEIDTLWTGLETHIAAFCLVDDPLNSEHKITESNYKTWSNDELLDLVSLMKKRYPNIPTLILYSTDTDFLTSIPINLEWIGVKYFPFHHDKIPDKDEFLNGWKTDQDETVYGIDDYVSRIKQMPAYNQRSIVLVGQAFGDANRYRVPSIESLQWYYDVTVSENNIQGLVWWRAFDPSGTNELFPFIYHAKSNTLSISMTNVVKLFREMGERFVRPWKP